MQREHWPSAVLGVLMILWFAFNSVANIATKEYFRQSSDVFLLTFVACGTGAVSILFVQQPKAWEPVLRTLFPVAALHFGNTLLTFASLQRGSIALTYVIKVFILSLPTA